MKRLEPLDWRYSAAIVGLSKYLEWLKGIDHTVNYTIDSEYLEYNEKDITKERYAEFVEYYYNTDLPHRKLETLLECDQFDAELIAEINEKLKANTVIKKVFNKVKFDGTNSAHLLKLIQDNRFLLTMETYRFKLDMYRNFCNTNQLLEAGKECCRLVGYYIDMPKKGKSVGYNFEKSNFNGTDMIEFDFIPFAFYGLRDVIFINDNCSLIELRNTNASWRGKVNALMRTAKEENKTITMTQMLFHFLVDAENFVKGNVELIIKNQNEEYYKTLFIREEVLKIFKKIKDDFDGFRLYFRETDNYRIDIQKNVLDAIFNYTLLDDTINYLLKKPYKENYSYAVSKLININVLLKGVENMNKGMGSAYGAAKSVVQKIPENKLIAFNRKLTSALTLEDYDRFCQILLNLSNYSEVSFGFAYDLFEDFEANKEIAYSFVNALRKDNKEYKK